MTGRTAGRLLLAGALAAGMISATAYAQQSAGDDMKSAGHSTKNAAVDTGHATKKAAKSTAHGTKVGAKKVGHGTKVAAVKTGHATENLGDKIAGKPATH